jgi:hypothetical protein
MSTKAAAGPSAPETIECPLCSGTGELNSAGCRKCNRFPLSFRSATSVSLTLNSCATTAQMAAGRLLSLSPQAVPSPAFWLSIARQAADDKITSVPLLMCYLHWGRRCFRLADQFAIRDEFAPSVVSVFTVCLQSGAAPHRVHQ